MQVSSIAELDTHAVIGGGKAEAFGMSESAEFFTVLSDTLYRDKIRAVAREVICNAWDAHIMVGKTDQPIEITLTDQELVIRDFGPGIAPDRMRPIYCIYGASTKIKDENQTGGFGLGSKAPFAYSDHFSVTSHYNGERTVYAISRGGEETDGKPDMRPMVKTPSKITGITVSIPIRGHADAQNFLNHVTAVVFQGGIPATLNGNAMKRIDYAEARKRGYALLGASYRSLMESDVYVLYGTVLYPVSGTNQALQEAVSRLRSLKAQEDRFILIAPANSVGVTPSRESLSYSDRTIKTLQGLMQSIEDSIKHEGKRAVKTILEGRLKAVKRYDRNVNLNGENHHTRSVKEKIVTDPKVIAQVAALTNMSHFTTLQERHKIVMDTMAVKFKDDRRYFRRNRKMPKRVDYYGSYEAMSPRDVFLHSSRLVRRLLAKFSLLDKAYAIHDRDYDRKRCSSLEECKVFDEVRPRLIISPTQREAIKAVVKYYADNRTKKDFVQGMTIAVVTKNMKDSDLEKIKEAAKHWNIEVDVLVVPKRSASARKDPGIYYALADIKHNKNSYAYKIDEVKSLPSAKYYMPIRGGVENLEMDESLFRVKEELHKRYGDVALAMTTRTEEKLKAKGAVNIYDVLFADLKKLNDSPENLLASMVSNSAFIKSPEYYTPARFVSDLIRYDTKFLTFFFGIKLPKVNTSVEDGKFLRDALSGGTSYGRLTRHTNEVHKESTRIHAAALKKFAPHILSNKQANDKFAYLKPLTDLHAQFNRNTIDIEGTLDLVKYLKRKHEAKTRMTTATNDNAAKEAA
ncbi:hypothetical protein B1VFA_002 [Rhizobium phage B1VFA]|nr:hypothetical protein B1VFA_002 [Rhizobium phage B1VFA]